MYKIVSILCLEDRRSYCFCPFCHFVLLSETSHSDSHYSVKLNQWDTLLTTETFPSKQGWAKLYTTGMIYMYHYMGLNIILPFLRKELMYLHLYKLALLHNDALYQFGFQLFKNCLIIHLNKIEFTSSEDTLCINVKNLKENWNRKTGCRIATFVFTPTE